MKLNRLAGKRPAAMALSIVATAAMLAAAGGATAAPTGSGGTELYLVQTGSAPLATNDSTKPADGEKVDARGGVAQQWLSRLRGEHDTVLRSSQVSTGRKVTDFGVVFNGFAAKLTAAEVARLRGNPDVVQVWKDETRYADTTTTRDFLGLSGSNGVWEKQFRGDEHAGEGIIVGVIDSGIWPESGSFAALSEPRPDRGAIARKWRGACERGDAADEGALISCNNKLIGARYFTEGNNVIPEEYLSPRDFGGHGTHTSSTSAGNHGVPASINGFSVGSTSGVAPAARIAMYKALWERADHSSSSGSTTGLVKAIEAAVADGVDVINYSISGSRTQVASPDEVAFFNAAAAGVFVSTSAGNSGDTVGATSVAHNSPWTTTVAASTHDRGASKKVTLGNGSTYAGVGVIPAAVASSPLVLGAAVAAAGATADDARLCAPGALDPAKAAGKIVVCDRGTYDRIAKGKSVRDAGGVGMVHTNTSDAQSINGDWHYVPTVHVNATAGAPIKAYAATAGATAALSATDTSPVTAPAMAGFSSYGPALAGNGDLLKPDITGPGADVIASVAPPGNDGKDFDAYSGTSMSAPHIAGIAALLMAKHPTWSPMAVKSAMMTTASTKDSAGRNIQWAFGDATPLNYGAGHVNAGSAFDPGLVYDSRSRDWMRYACGLGQWQLSSKTGPKECARVGSIDASDLNYASIAVGDLPGTQTVTRSVKNVTWSLGIYKPEVTAPAGYKITVSPSMLVVLPGQTVSFKVTITRTDAPYNKWAFGSLTLRETGTGKHVVTSPIAVRPVGVSAATQVDVTGTSGSSQQAITAGFDGTLSQKVSGLAAASSTALAYTGKEQNFSTTNPAEGPGTKKVTVTVPEGTKLARFATYDSEVPAGTDIDIHVYKAGTKSLVGSSAGATAEESISLSAAGSYDIYVVLYDYPADVPAVKHHAFVVPDTDAGNLAVTPGSQQVSKAGKTSVTFTWSGLTPGVRYLGVVTYSDGTNVAGSTIVSVS